MNAMRLRSLRSSCGERSASGWPRASTLPLVGRTVALSSRSSVWDAWGFYNLTKCEQKEHVPPTEPVLQGGTVSPIEADVADPFVFNVTYFDVNDESVAEEPASSESTQESSDESADSPEEATEQA